MNWWIKLVLFCLWTQIQVTLIIFGRMLSKLWMAFSSCVFEICYISRMNWWNEFIFTYWYKFIKAEIYFHDFWMGEVKNWCDLIGNRTLKSVVSQERIDELNWFCACWYKSVKVKKYFNDFRLWNSKICCISRVNWWSWFCMLIKMQ